MLNLSKHKLTMQYYNEVRISYSFLIFFCFILLFFFCHFFDGSCKLVGTWGSFAAAVCAAQALYHILCLHADDKRRDAFGIAVATACKFHFFYYAVLNGDLDLARAYAFRLVYGCRFHLFFLSAVFLEIFIYILSKNAQKNNSVMRFFKNFIFLL